VVGGGGGAGGGRGPLVEFEYPEQEALNGNPESAGGSGKTCTCQGALTTTGGVGGTPIDGGQPGSDGQPDYDGDGSSGHGGDPDSACGSGGGGDDGAAAPSVDPAPGATVVGVLGSTGWQPAPGMDGETGKPGQGGGGGASRNENGHGGGGGCGGCGGNGGTKGFGGGASIALLVVDSEVALDVGKLSAGNAGAGGSGHVGQTVEDGLVGGGGGVNSTTNSCYGGAGGPGAAGGASGGGAGGISVGIVWTGDEEPAQTNVVFELGTAGDGGIGGEPGVNDGIDGLARDTYEVP
jgi:hypothetical protein